jgi:hypothetical protein
MTTQTQLQAAIRDAQQIAVEHLAWLTEHASNEFLQIKAARVLVNMKVRRNPKKRRGGGSVKPEKPIPF